MTNVWPALWPPWKRTTMSACSESQSRIFPLPSSPHWEPTTTTLAIKCPSARPEIIANQQGLAQASALPGINGSRRLRQGGEWGQARPSRPATTVPRRPIPGLVGSASPRNRLTKRRSRGDIGAIGREGRANGDSGPLATEPSGFARVSRQGSWQRLSPPRSKLQRPRLLHLRQCAHLGEYVGRQLAVDLDERDGVATGCITADMDGRDIDTGVTQRRGELADEARLVEIGDIDHRRADLRVHADTLDVDDARTPVGIDGARHVPRLPLGNDRHGDQALV